MDDLNSGLLQINLSSEIINGLYTIIYGDIEEPAATSYGNYALLENYKANYLLYNNSIGLFGVAAVSQKTTKVINYIDKLFNQLKSEPEFWSKLAVAIRNEKTIFTPKIINKYQTDGNGIITATTSTFAPNKDYRVYNINAKNSLTGKTLFATQEVNDIKKGSSVKSLAYKTTLVGYIDSTIFGGINRIIGTSDGEIVINEQGDSTITKDKITFKLVSNRKKNKELLRRNGYYSKVDLKLLLKPDFVSKTFKGGLYMNIEKVGYKLMANFQDTV
ncbi:hypothetical protein [Nostoc sp. NMS8]|uniref:hypothetical protein n=1 Tax=Nostoc sp. NMS8 TaxID=2815392 RepID=UPI0025CFEB47|nr:hypothetical protein [Nostoc sp. NMS8]MBN3962250.1 hypothetical protein [Nostoc sp. NMS8]